MICKHDGLSNHKLGYAKLNVQNAALREYYKEAYIVFFHLIQEISLTTEICLI